MSVRFWSKVDASGDCWEWTAYVASDGYGRFRPTGRSMTTAHRVAWELLVGPIPEGLELDHLCRNKGCVKPDHLEPVTHRENVLRGYGLIAQQARQTACHRGHRFTTENTYIMPSSGGRACRECTRISHRAKRQQRKERTA